MVNHDPNVAAEWWEKHSNSPMGAQYAAMIRANGEGYALARGQLSAIIAKGSIKGRAKGIMSSGGVEGVDTKPRRGRKSRG